MRILRNEEDARECLQESFLNAHRHIGTFRGDSSVATWLHRIVTNVALMKLRSRKSRPEWATDTVDFLVLDEHGFRVGPTRVNELTPERILQSKNAQELIRDAIVALPDAYRAVCWLRDIEGYSTREAAEFLETNEGVVKVRLHRARTALAESLRPLFEEELK